MYYYSNAILGEGINRVIEVTSTALISEPVSINEAAQFCKIEVPDDENLLLQMITAARMECEDFCGIGFVNSDRVAVLQNELGGIRIPFSPVFSIASIYDEYGGEITADYYSIRGETVKHIIAPLSSYLKISYNSGYDILPAKFKQQILNQILYLYQNRGEAVNESYAVLAPQVRAALSKYRVIA
jgi:hypothetical protein